MQNRILPAFAVTAAMLVAAPHAMAQAAAAPASSTPGVAPAMTSRAGTATYSAKAPSRPMPSCVIVGQFSTSLRRHQ